MPNAARCVGGVGGGIACLSLIDRKAMGRNENGAQGVHRLTDDMMPEQKVLYFVFILLSCMTKHEH